MPRRRRELRKAHRAPAQVIDLDSRRREEPIPTVAEMGGPGSVMVSLEDGDDLWAGVDRVLELRARLAELAPELHDWLSLPPQERRGSRPHPPLPHRAEAERIVAELASLA